MSGKINWDAKVTKAEKCTVVNFPLNFYAGKGKDGAKYGNIQCTSFDEQVANLVSNVGKGGKIIVHGNLTSDEYTNKVSFAELDGCKSTKDKGVIIDKLHILETAMNDFLHIDNI